MTDWPTGTDLTTWIGGSTSPELTALAATLVDEATEAALRLIPTACVSSSRRPGGSAPDCPPDLKRLIIMEAAQLHAMRSPEAAFTVTTAHRQQLAELRAAFTNWPEP